MGMHQASGRWKLGLLLALVTAACWSTLPVALKITLESLDPYTLTWFRFVIAGGVMLAWLGMRGGLGQFVGLGRSRWHLLLLAGVLLIGNYVFYLLGVQHTTPGNAQLLIQLAPLLMALGGIVIFRERYAWGQAGPGHHRVGLAGVLPRPVVARTDQRPRICPGFKPGGAGGDRLGRVRPDPETAADAPHVAGDHALHLFAGQRAAVATGESGGAVETGREGLVAAGLLRIEYTGGVRRIRGSAGALAGVAGVHHPGHDAAAEPGRDCDRARPVAERG